MNITAAQTINLKNNAASTDTVKEVKLQKACRDFESIMLKQMLTTMRKSVPKSGLFGDNFADEMYQSMSDDELAKSLAQSKGMGLGDALYKQISGQIKNTI